MKKDAGIKKIKELVENNEIKDAIKELKKMAGDKILNELISQSARYNYLKKQIRLDIISFEDANLNLNKVRFSILELIDELENQSKAEGELLIGSGKNVFILMPFSSPFDEYYQTIFKKSLEELGFKVKRADDLYAPRPIMDDVRNFIKEADLILCEMTTRNPNVFYELGLAHAIGKPVVLVSQKEEDIPFDLRAVRVILYNTISPSWADDLRRKIQLASKEIFENNNVWPPPLIEIEKQQIDLDKYIELDKVQSLKWHRLSDLEQKRMYERFLALKPQHNKQRSKVVTKEIQDRLNHINPIDLSPLLNLLKAFNLDVSPIQLPIDEETYDLVHPLDIIYGNKICDQIEKGLNEEQKKCLDEYYDYLSCQDSNADNLVKRKCDVVVVPGTRKGHPYRVDEAYNITLQSQCSIILSGLHPYYDKDQELQIGESEAMYYYLEKIKKLDTRQVKVYMETRARNTRENAVHIIPTLQKISQDKGKKLNLIIVTAPYHMRRFKYLITKGLNDHQNIINEINCTTSSTTFGRRIFFDSNYDNRRYGVIVYLQEYFKIIGGRATGEF